MKTEKSPLSLREFKPSPLPSPFYHARVYAIRRVVFASEAKEVIAEQLGDGDFYSRTEVDAFVAAQSLPCRIIKIAGIEDFTASSK